jgi:hypothetical protein
MRIVRSIAEPQDRPAQNEYSSGDGDVLETYARARVAVRPEPMEPASLERWSLMEEELIRAHRIATDGPEGSDIDWLRKGFSAFLAGGGKISLERCLSLPTNERALRRARRDQWLRTAWRELDPALSPWRRSEALAVEINRFQTSKWVRWSKLTTVPADARKIDGALFEAFRSHERIPSTAMHLHNIAAHRSD